MPWRLQIAELAPHVDSIDAGNLNTSGGGESLNKGKQKLDPELIGARSTVGLGNGWVLDDLAKRKNWACNFH